MTVLRYSDAIEDKIDLIMAELKRKYPGLTNYRWYAIKLLEQDKEITANYPVDLPDVLDRNYESDIINEKYDFIQEIIREVLVNKDRQDALTEKVDRVLTHKVWSIPIFLVIMAVVFFLTFTIGDWLKGYFEMGIESLSALISDGLVAAGVNEVLRSLLVDGIIAGVGGILTFLPNIFILFLALAFLEDSGYMARVAYVMEGIMSKLGLSGRAFIPMILGFGCTVPAIMASRTLENRRDRFKVMLITPFMSCSARLPIYILFAEMFFADRAMLVAYSMYLIGLVVAILVAAVIHLIDRKTSENYLLIELPEYKAPSGRTVAIYVWEKVKDYLTKAGTTIFMASILMWAILNFGPHGYTTEMTESFGAILGHWLVPFFAPIGLGLYTSPQVEIIKTIHKRLTSNLQERPTIEELSKEYLINPTTLKDTFKGIFGQPIGTYMKEYRIRQAAVLLRQTQATIAEIANKVGYENQSKFATAFRDVLKISPAEYRKQNAGD